MKKEMGHVFLKKLGKTRLRPGGVTGTNFLLDNINFEESPKILEIACNRGVNLLQLASTYRNTSFVGIDLDQKSIDEANSQKEKLGLSNVEFFVMDAFRLEFADESFDYVINEAMLTMFSDKMKTKALNEYYRVLKNNGLLLTHDIMLINNFENTRKILSESINVNVFPLPKQEWEQIFSDSKFHTISHENGELTLMTPRGMIKDEGIINTLKIIKNGLKKENRKQFLKMKTTFTKLKKDMNYICFVNKK